MGSGWSSLLRTASSVGISPSVRILSSTISTLSGRWRALSMSPALPKSTNMRSVPAENSVREVQISKARDQRVARDFGYFGSAVCQVLEDLFHRACACAGAKVGSGCRFSSLADGCS